MTRLALLLVTASLCAACVMQVDETPKGKSKTTEAPAASAPKAESAPTATSIPGITLSDITQMFEQKGFKCSDIGTETNVAWTCDRGETTFGYTVQAFGSARDALKEIKIESTALSGDPNEVARPLLLKAADIKYTGADPDAIRTFIVDNLGKDAETVIAGVRMRISATGSLRTLHIGV